MEAGFLEAFLENGSMGLFAAFLVWQHLSMQKRFDNLYASFKDQLKDMQQKNEEKESSIRERYDTVISGLQDEKSSFRVDVKGRVDTAILKIDDVGKKIEEIKVLSESLNMLQRDTAIQSEKALDILKQMAEEAKLKEMARKMQAGTEPNWERR